MEKFPSFKKNTREAEENIFAYNELFEIASEPLNPKYVSIHIHSADDLTPAEKMKKFVEGMKGLARLINVSQYHKETSYVVACSWIVREHPALLRRLGFTIDDSALPDIQKYERDVYAKGQKIRDYDIKEEHRDTEPAFAYISREDLLNRYGTPEPEALREAA